MFRVVCTEVRVKRSMRSSLISVLRSPSMWLMATMWVFAAGANLGVYFMTPLYMTKELGLDLKYANEIFGFSRIGGVVLTIAMGFAVDRFSLRKIMFVQLLFGGLLTVIIPFTGAAPYRMGPLFSSECHDGLLPCRARRHFAYISPGRP